MEACCNPRTCKFYPGAECLSGACCSGCKLLPSDYTCRASRNTCDVPEVCDGVSPQVWKTPCHYVISLYFLSFSVQKMIAFLTVHHAIKMKVPVSIVCVLVPKSNALIFGDQVSLPNDVIRKMLILFHRC